MKGFFGVCVALAFLNCLASSANSNQPWVVEFRLPGWKTMHFSGEEKAEHHLVTVKKLGCEAQKLSHDNHYDVRYRCVKWKQMTLDTDAEAHLWVRWLKQVGFETIHEH